MSTIQNQTLPETAPTSANHLDQETTSDLDLVIDSFSPIRVALLGFKTRDGVQLPKKLVAFDPINKELYTLVMSADGMKCTHEEKAAFLDHIEGAKRQAELSGVPTGMQMVMVPVGPDGKPSIPGGIVSPGGLIIPGGG